MSTTRSYLGEFPRLGAAVYIDASAEVIGRVSCGDDVSIWPQSVVRGDVNRIEIGERSNVQDGCIIHVSRPTAKLPEGWPTIIGAEVTIGHGVILHGCQIKDRVLVGNGAIVLDGAVIEENAMIGAGTLVPPGKTLESGYLYIGSPCRQLRPLSEAEIAHFATSADNYVRLKNEYLQQGD